MGLEGMIGEAGAEVVGERLAPPHWLMNERTAWRKQEISGGDGISLCEVAALTSRSRHADRSSCDVAMSMLTGPRACLAEAGSRLLTTFWFWASYTCCSR